MAFYGTLRIGMNTAQVLSVNLVDFVKTFVSMIEIQINPLKTLYDWRIFARRQSVAGVRPL